jgi:hypothetical protein
MIDKTDIYKELDEAAFLDKVASYRGESAALPKSVQSADPVLVSPTLPTLSARLTQVRTNNKTKKAISYFVMSSSILVWASLFIYPIAAILFSLVSTPAFFLDKQNNWRYASYLIMFFGGLFTMASLIRILLF